MSDLAPFVAAALHDKVMTELLEENRRLKTQLQSFQQVRITGKDGFPVYAEHNFTTGKPTDHGWWVVPLPPHRHNHNHNMESQSEASEQQTSSCSLPIPCPMSQLAECEIHVGNFRNMTCRDFNDCFFDGNPKGYFSLFATKGLWLCCYLERLSDPHYRSLCRAAAEQTHLSSFIHHHFDEPMEDLNVYFTHLTFCGGSASEAIRHWQLLPERSTAPTTASTRSRSNR